MTHLERIVNFAFVMPVYDFFYLDSFAPSLEGSNIGYKAYGWNIDTQRWNVICDFTEDHSEAVTASVKHHNKCIERCNALHAFMNLENELKRIVDEDD